VGVAVVFAPGAKARKGLNEAQSFLEQVGTTTLGSPAKAVLGFWGKLTRHLLRRGTPPDVPGYFQPRLTALIDV